jgi:hypothetical protein
MLSNLRYLKNVGTFLGLAMSCFEVRYFGPEQTLNIQAGIFDFSNKVVWSGKFVVNFVIGYHVTVVRLVIKVLHQTYLLLE